MVIETECEIMGINGNPSDERYIEGVRENYELVDDVKDTGDIKPVKGVVVDAESEEMAFTYHDGTAEIIPFSEFPEGELGAILTPTTLSPIE